MAGKEFTVHSRDLDTKPNPTPKKNETRVAPVIEPKPAKLSKRRRGELTLP